MNSEPENNKQAFDKELDKIEGELSRLGSGNIKAYDEGDKIFFMIKDAPDKLRELASELEKWMFLRYKPSSHLIKNKFHMQNESDLLNYLSKKYKKIGDDGAILSLRKTAISTDLLIENIHFKMIK